MSFFYQIVSWTSTSFEVSGEADYPGSQIYPGQRIRVQDNAQAQGATPPENNNYDFIVDSLDIGTPNTTVINIKTSSVPSGYLTSVPTPTAPATRFIGLVAGQYEIRLTQDCRLLTTILPFEVDGAIQRCVDVHAGSPFGPLSGGSPLNVVYGSPLPSCSLDLPGRGTLNYGELILENMVRMLENFANDDPPISPLIGQIWYDTNTSPVGPHVYTEGSPNWDPIQTESVADTNYLRLDTTNDPMQGDLDFDGVYDVTQVAQIRGEDGANTAPTYSFVNDNNSGMYSIANGTIGWAINGVDRMNLNGSILTISQGGNARIRLDDGTAATPAFSFTNDNDVGMYLSGTNELSFSTNSTRRLTIESNGTLNVSGTSTYEDLVTSDDDIPNKKYVDDLVGGTFVAAGGDGEIQFNSGGSPGGVFDATPNLTWDGTKLIVTGIGSPQIAIETFGDIQVNSEYSFGADPDVSVAQDSGGLVFKTGGVERVRVESSGVISVPAGYDTLVTSDTHIASKKYVDDTIATTAFPSGIIMPFAGSTPPTGFLLCNGASHATATYPNLFAVIGYTYGGAGPNFNVPNLLGRTVAGVNGGTFTSLGTVVGAETATAPLPVHNHTAGFSGGSTSFSGSHTHVNQHGNQWVVHPGAGGNLTYTQNPGAINNTNGVMQASGSDHSHTVSGTVTVNNAGTGGAHNNIQPTISLNYIIAT